MFSVKRGWQRRCRNVEWKGKEEDGGIGAGAEAEAEEKLFMVTVCAYQMFLYGDHSPFAYSLHLQNFSYFDSIPRYQDVKTAQSVIVAKKVFMCCCGMMLSAIHVKMRSKCSCMRPYKNNAYLFRVRVRVGVNKYPFKPSQL